MQQQNNLFDKGGNSKIDKSLIAFAFLAQANSGNGDILSGIIPIFKPIAKSKAGEIFNANDFSKIVSNLYGISIHPWAIDELAPRLENAGILKKALLDQKTAEYYYSDIKEEFNEVSEEDILLIIKKFTEFSKPILISNDLPFNEKALEEAFFDQLISMDFVSILKKPDRSKEQKYNKETIRVKKSEDQTQWENDLNAKSKIEVLCASFILDVYKKDRNLYELLVKISNGAFVAEAVLNFRAPQGVGELNQLKVILDAPFIMSLLNLSLEETHKYAKTLCESLTSHGARLYAFKHSCDEIKDNLNAVISLNETGEGYGTTARRLNNTSFKAFAISVKNSPEAALKQIGIEVVKPLDKATAYQFFTEKDEENFRNSLDHYANSTAQYRDAESIAYLLRLRKGKQTKMINFTKTEFIFLTENQTLAKKATRFLEKNNFTDQSVVPAAMTDRSLAGLLLALYGGQINEFTHYRLLANCSAALETRNDVIKKITEFLSKVDDQQAVRFRAMMTEERAGQCLMQLSLGDPILLNDKNIPQIVEEVKKSLIEEHRKQAENEKRALESTYKQEVENKDKSIAEMNSRIFEAETNILIANKSIKSANEEKERIKKVLDDEKLSNLENDRQRVEKSVLIASKIENGLKIILGLIIAWIVYYFTLLKSGDHNENQTKMIAIAAGLGAYLSYIKITEWIFGKFQTFVRKKY